MTSPGMDRATIKGIKADYVKHTITLTLECHMDDFEDADRAVIAQWAEFEMRVDVQVSRSVTPAPLLEQVEQDGQHER